MSPIESRETFFGKVPVTDWKEELGTILEMSSDAREIAQLWGRKEIIDIVRVLDKDTLQVVLSKLILARLPGDPSWERNMYEHLILKFKMGEINKLPKVDSGGRFIRRELRWRP